MRKKPTQTAFNAMASGAGRFAAQGGQEFGQKAFELAGDEGHVGIEIIAAALAFLLLGFQQRDAAQLRLALVGKDSASGGFVPVRELRRLGLAPATAFAHLAYAGSHAAALEAVASGNADVAALAADVYDAARPAGVVELWRSEPIPPGPLLCRPAADVPCQQFTDWLLDAHNEAPAVMAALRAGWPEFGDAMVFVPAPTVLLTPALLD